MCVWQVVVAGGGGALPTCVEKSSGWKRGEVEEVKRGGRGERVKKGFRTYDTRPPHRGSVWYVGVAAPHTLSEKTNPVKSDSPPDQTNLFSSGRMLYH